MDVISAAKGFDGLRQTRISGIPSAGQVPEAGLMLWLAGGLLAMALRRLRFARSVRYRLVCLTTLALFGVSLVTAQTFGTVVPIGGHASDLVLDEPRGMLYVANFTANRIEKLNLANNSIQTSINVAQQPGAMAMSADGQYLVITHYGPWSIPSAADNGITVIRLVDGTQRKFALDSAPVGVAFGKGAQALVVTTKEFLLLDPRSGAIQVLETIEDAGANMLPQPLATFPPQIVAASLAPSGDGRYIFGIVCGTNYNFQFRFDYTYNFISSFNFVAAPPLGPMVTSVNRDGSFYTAGWGLFDAKGVLWSEFSTPAGVFNIGSTVIDSAANLIYAQVPASVPQTPPLLTIVDADNLTLREKILLPENLAGRSVITSSGATMYSISDSGVLILPVGSLNRQHRVKAGKEDLLFQGDACGASTTTQQVTISNPGGGNTPFVLTASSPSIHISPSSGVTPVTVTVYVDMAAYQSQLGTVVESIQIRSASAVNVPDPVRVLINSRTPDMRGTIVNVPGTLVDVLADSVRERFYVLRQDKNQVLVFNAATYAPVATLRTANTPTQMALSFDNKFLLVGHNDSQLVYVFDLDTLQPSPPVVLPLGHYPKSVAVSGRRVLAASRVAGGPNTIDSLDLIARRGATLPSLGVWENKINVDTMLAASPNGSSILGVQADGYVWLYSGSADTFTVSRKDFDTLQGAYGASSYGVYIADNHLLDASLVPIATLASNPATSSGVAFVDGLAVRTMAPAPASNLNSSSQSVQIQGVIERANLATGDEIRPMHITEAPLVNAAGAVFSRTLAPLANRNAIVSLTTSGVTVLAWQYDAAVAPPRISKVVNAADFTSPVAPGGLISLFGSQLNAISVAANEVSAGGMLGGACLTVNGAPVPMLYVSPQQINAQLPFNAEGNAALVLYSPGGVSDNYNLSVSTTAPAIFHSGTAGPMTGIPTVFRASNQQLVTNSNPVHPNDYLVIYLTGMGATAPKVETGAPAPYDPLANAAVSPDVTLGGVPLFVKFAGLSPGSLGVYQINLLVPFKGIPTGFDIPLAITQGGTSTAVPVRVVN